MASHAEIAAHLFMSRQAVSEWFATGRFPSRGRGRADLDECREIYIRHIRAVASGHRAEGDDGEILDLTAERARKAKEEADRLEMQNAHLRGELLSRHDVDAAVIEDYSRVRARLLNIPSKVAPLVAATTEPREAEGLVRRAVNEALSELSDPAALWPTGAGMAGGAEAAAEPDGKRVGGRRKTAER